MSATRRRAHDPRFTDTADNIATALRDRLPGLPPGTVGEVLPHASSCLGALAVLVAERSGADLTAANIAFVNLLAVAGQQLYADHRETGP